jgi:hypothetical protein
VPLDVAVDLKDLERTERGSIVGRVWLVLDDYAFPERGWSDLIVVVLGWWIEELLQIQSEETTMTLLFMDGPYSVRLRAPAEGDLWSVSLLRDRGPIDARREAAGSVKLTELRTAVVSVAREVLAACRKKGWSDDQEVVKLTRLADALATRVPTGRSVDR